MPFNGAGVFTRIYQWVNDAALGINVDATRTDTDTNDIANGLTNCVTRDGQSPPSANIPMGGYKLTGLANGSDPQDATTFSQVFTNPTFNTPNAATTPTLGSNNLRLATTAYVDQTALSAALPAQSLGLLVSDGTNASFTDSLAFGLNFGRATVASHATTADIWGALGNQIDFTGTATVTDFPAAPQAGANRVLVCAGACAFTAGANLLISGVPSGATFPCEANDQVLVQALSTTQFLLTIIPYTGAQIRTGMTIDFAGITVPGNFLLCDGSAISRSTYARLFAVLTANKGNFTITIAAPGVITLVGHGMETGDVFSATTTGALPTGMTASTNYYFIKNDADTGWFATTYANAFAGTKVTTSGSQSGTHSLRLNPFGISGASDFLLPNTTGRTTIGIGATATATIGNTLGSVGGSATHSLTSAENGPHTHSFTDNFGVGTTVGTAHPKGVYNNSTDIPLVSDSSGSGSPHNNMQPSIVMRKIIKT